MRLKTKLKIFFRIPIIKKDCTPEEWEELDSDADKYTDVNLEKD